MSQKRPPAVPQPGEMLDGRYRLKEQLGRGGFGIVFRATQLGLDEDVAIKIVRPHVAENAGLTVRFEREIFIAKQLRHPNTIRVFDVSRTKSGLPYYVMEYVDGESLAAALEKEGTLSSARTGHIAVQILKGLAEAHDKGVVHRDLKPANVLLCKVFGEPDFVKVLDFGIAKALSGPPSKQTSADSLLGTPSYLSPEQAWSAKDIDGRSDLYSVGLIMAECLSGRPVVEADSVLKIVAAHVSPRPLVLPPEVLASPLASVIQRALQKDPSRRFQNAQAMIEAVVEAADGSPRRSDLPFVVSHGRPEDLEAPRSPFGDTPATLNLGESPPAPPDWAEGLASTLAPPTPRRTAPDPADVATRTAAINPLIGASRRRTWMLAIFSVLLVGLVGVLALVLGSDDAPPPARETAPAPATLQQTPPGESLALTPPSPDPPRLEPPSPDALAAPPVSLGSGEPISAPVAGASLGSGSSAWWPVMRMHLLSFEGAPGVAVSFQGQLLGTTPFSIIAPGLPGEVEMVLARPGRAEERVMVRLDQDRFAVPP